MPHGIRPINRSRLERLHRRFDGPFSPADAAKELGLIREQTAELLRGLCDRGWLVRVARGAYGVVPLGALDPKDWRIDVWQIAAKLFDPCYIGGWSAAEHWGLTEQVFRSTFIFTTRAVRRRDVSIQKAPLRLTHIASNRLFGLKSVWRERVEVKVSDPSRTLADMLDDPALGGGIRHVAEMVRTYFDGEHRNERRLLDDVKRLSNGAAWKRLGHLVEVLGIEAPLVVERCLRHVTAGLVRLDPAIKSGGVIRKRWNLRVNVETSNGSRSS